MLTASQLQDLIVATLARQHGRTQRHWRAALGPVKLLDPALYPHCNWSVAPHGESREVAEIERLLDSIRLAHPIVAEG
jgi:hypothetical protein